MRRLFVLSALFFAQFARAGLVNLPAESGAPVNEDDWSIPLHRCLRSTETGVGVYDGAERCMVEFAIPLPRGRHLERVRALYADEDGVSQFRMKVRVRDAATGVQLELLSGQDDAAAPVVLESMMLEPDYLVQQHDAVFALVEVLGNTRLLAFSYEYQ